MLGETHYSQGSLTCVVQKTDQHIDTIKPTCFLDLEGFTWSLVVTYSTNGGNYWIRLTCEDQFKSASWLCKARYEIEGGSSKNVMWFSPEKNVHETTFRNRNNRPSVKMLVTILSVAGYKKIKPFNFFQLSHLSNVVIKIDDKELYVNKEMLSLNSPVFEKLFYTDLSKPDGESHVELTDVDATEFEYFLRVIYPSSCAVDDSNVEYLLKLADRFQVTNVFKACETFLCRSDQRTKMESLKLADKYNLPAVVFECLVSLKSVDDIREFAKKEGFDRLSPAMQNHFYEKLV